MKPDAKPKVWVNKAAPMAVTAVLMVYSAPNRGKTIRNIGVNRAAPPMPLNIAVVEMAIATGNMNQ